MEKTLENGKILIIEDDSPALALATAILKRKNFEVVGVSTVQEANKKVAESFMNDNEFVLALVDLHLGENSGAELGRRLIEIAGLNVIIVTAHPYPAASLPYQPDAIIIKPYNIDTLLETVEQFLRPQHINLQPPDVKLNHWLATAGFSGFNDLQLHSRKIENSIPGINVEKIIGKSTRDESFVSSVIYHNQKVDDGVVNVALSSLLGCPACCSFCKHWKTHKNSIGLPVVYKRSLSEGEIVGQAYLAMRSPRLVEALKKNSTKKLTFNFTCEGDGLVYNLDNCIRAIKQLKKITYPRVDFIITSIGSEESLRMYIQRYVNMQQIRHYWSVDSLNNSIRERLKPGTAGVSLERMRDSYEIIATLSGTSVTVSWVLIKGINDSFKDAEAIAHFFKNRPFVIKLMSLVPDSLPGEKHATKRDVSRFHEYLDKLGLTDVREREIIGSGINAGCGNTVEEWEKTNLII
jgi:23S rRNA (adenine2503-C2)-methyltransferase